MLVVAMCCSTAGSRRRTLLDFTKFQESSYSHLESAMPRGRLLKEDPTYNPGQALLCTLCNEADGVISAVNLCSALDDFFDAAKEDVETFIKQGENGEKVLELIEDLNAADPAAAAAAGIPEAAAAAAEAGTALEAAPYIVGALAAAILACKAIDKGSDFYKKVFG